MFRVEGAASIPYNWQAGLMKANHLADVRLVALGQVQAAQPSGTKASSRAMGLGPFAP